MYICRNYVSDNYKYCKYFLLISSKTLGELFWFLGVCLLGKGAAAGLKPYKKSMTDLPLKYIHIIGCPCVHSMAYTFSPSGITLGPSNA